MALTDIIRDKEEGLRRLKAAPDYAARLVEIKERAAGAGRVRDFLYAVTEKGGPGAVRIIAEVKKASPSKGVIRADFRPVEIARTYEENGAAALSVLTEEKFFQGSLTYLEEIKGHVRIPLLRKDFILDEFQVYESRASGADAVLLIAAILDEENLRALIGLVSTLGMSPLVEVHTEEELRAALGAGAEIIGINNRDLKTFRTDTDVTRRLAPLVPEDKFIISESGINTYEDIMALKGLGVRAFLVGEALMREPDAGRKLRELKGEIVC